MTRPGLGPQLTYTPGTVALIVGSTGIGVAIDGNGDLFTTDGAAKIYETMAVNRSIPASNPTVRTIPLPADFQYFDYGPVGVAVD